MGLEVEVVGETNKFDVICVGGGIAGMTAATLLSQKGLKSCFLEKDVPGGKLMHVEAIHNLEGYDGINGATFANNYFEYAVNQTKAKYIFGNVQSMKLKADKIYLWTEDGQAWETKALIIAVGTVINRLNLPSEEKFMNKGLSYCVLCDSSLAKDKNVVLVGNQNHLDHLKQFAKNVTTLPSNEIKDYYGNNNLEGIVKQDGSKIPCEMVFVENGFKTDLSFLVPEVKINNKNEVEVNADMATACEGVFACGDCTNGVKLISNAIQQAQIAANSAEKYIRSKKW